MQLCYGVGDRPEKVMYVQLLFSIDFRLCITVGLCVDYGVEEVERIGFFTLFLVHPKSLKPLHPLTESSPKTCMVILVSS